MTYFNIVLPRCRNLQQFCTLFKKLHLLPLFIPILRIVQEFATVLHTFEKTPHYCLICILILLNSTFYLTYTYLIYDAGNCTRNSPLLNILTILHYLPYTYTYYRNLQQICTPLSKFLLLPLFTYSTHISTYIYILLSIPMSITDFCNRIIHI